MPTTGYLHMPTIAGDTVVFVTEDDLWSVPADGGLARRLTASVSSAISPALSPDGTQLAFISQEEGHNEAWVMPATGGTARRLTWLGGTTHVRGWTPDGDVLIVSDAGQAFAGTFHPYSLAAAGGTPQPLNIGPSNHVSWGKGGAMVIGRNTVDPAVWKRYRGGRVGDLWIDARGTGTFKRLVALNGNVTTPMWVGRRIYFLSDHEGIGNLYSVKPDGTDIQRHSHHHEYYARQAAADGRRIVYRHAAEVWLFDPASGEPPAPIAVDLASPRTQRARKFADSTHHLFGYAVHPAGHSVSVETRGKLFTMPLWERAVRQHGETDGVRYRHARWVGDGSAIIVVSDAGGDDALELHDPVTLDVQRLDTLDLGCITDLATPPSGRTVAVTNHRGELHIVDIDRGHGRLVDTSPAGGLSDVVWSPDGKWLAYSFRATRRTSSIKLCDVGSGRTHSVTDAEFYDYAPSFDPDGKYLYFLSARVYDPVYDMLYFDLGFPKGVRPYLVTLSRDDTSPFIPTPRGLAPDAPDHATPGDDGSSASTNGKSKNGSAKTAPSLRIDVDGIGSRVVAFPVPEGRYTKVIGIAGKVLFVNEPVEGSLGHDTFDTDPQAVGSLEVFDFAEQHHDVLLPNGVTEVEVSRDGHTLVYRSGNRLRAIKAGEKPADGTEHDEPGRKSGWIDLDRIRVSVDPGAEWRQMYFEAWRLQRDHFWVADMSGVDWNRIRDRYLPLVDRVASRREFSDVLWEMQGELGTSHAYEVGGDYRPSPHYALGHLGADIIFDGRRWKVEHIVAGDTWDESTCSPLRAPGVNVAEGDTILAINGRALTAATPPASLLVNQAGLAVELTVADGRGRRPRTVVVKTMRDVFAARYREWVDTNRARVHAATNGRVGYVHVPDMGANGYAEFHRTYGAEVERDGLIVDVRFNRGGHVSSLVLEKLARKRIGYNIPRWGLPEPYPDDSPAGPIVALTNEAAGSDGDIFSHCFKLMGLGPLIGKRTWGGVIGISPSHALADGTLTTQPEYSFWFADVGWGVENYGTNPDIDIDVKPQDYAAGRDPQMDKALELITRALRDHRPLVADVKRRPNLALPVLPTPANL